MTTKTLRTAVLGLVLALSVALGAAMPASATMVPTSPYAPSTGEVWPAVVSPAVYFVPHQDDETLTMGADIENHWRHGRYVIIVMMTRGDASGVLAKFQSTTYPSMTATQFIDGRNSEMRAAVGHLGVRPWRIFYEGLQDSATGTGMTQPQVEAVMAKWMARYPRGSFKTMHSKDDHPDHRTMAYAMDAQCKARHLTDCRYLQFRRYWTKYPVAGTLYRGSASYLAAANEYKVLDPAHGRYAIGSQSVPKDFAALPAAPYSKVIYSAR